MDPSPAAPRPARRPHARSHHGETVADPYHWLADPADDAVISHLRAENAWTEAATAHQQGRRDAIFGEIRSRTLETDLSVPVRDGHWWYLDRTVEGLEYPISCRRPDDGTGTAWVADPDTEQVVFDPNVEPGAEDYLSLGILEPSPDGNWLAYALDRAGDERHELRFRDLRTGEEAPETVPDVSYGFGWSADSSTCWYTTLDEAERPDRVLRHVVGTDPGTDAVILREDDPRFHVSVGASRSGDVVAIAVDSAVTSEIWLLDAHRPTDPPAVVLPRATGVEYTVSHRPGELYVTINDRGAEDFALWRAALDGIVVIDRADWTALIEHRPGNRLLGSEAFAEHVIVHGRTNGVSAIWTLDPGTGALREFSTDEEAGTLSPGANPSFDSTSYRFGYQSLTTPAALYEETVATGERRLLKQQPVLGEFDPDLYRSERTWATAADGTSIPVSVVWRPDRTGDGSAPTVLYAYGAYEMSMDPWFSTARLSLLDRGVAFAIAHCRGGGEMGRRWYEDGKLGAKDHTFSDVVACARHLVDTGRTDRARVAIRGGSAGGLAVGAAVNLDPEQFRVAVAEVPFVDPLTTMLDPSLPLTVTEWDEWGDPLHDPEAYRWLAGYSPYENVLSADQATYPAILATAGLTDPRVGYSEPLKWVARLRDQGHGVPTGEGNRGRPVLCKIELDAGHGGPTGRYASWREEAFVLAFILDELGVPEP